MFADHNLAARRNPRHSIRPTLTAADAKMQDSAGEDQEPDFFRQLSEKQVPDRKEDSFFRRPGGRSKPTLTERDYDQIIASDLMQSRKTERTVKQSEPFLGFQKNKTQQA